MNIQEPETLKHMAHIVDGKVVNVSLWDGATEWSPAEEVVEISKGTNVGIGWDYVDGVFTDNRPTINYEVE